MSLSSGGLKVTVIGSIAASLAMLALALRCWSRYMKRMGFNFNDYAIVGATVLALSGVGINLAGMSPVCVPIHPNQPLDVFTYVL